MLLEILVSAGIKLPRILSEDYAISHNVRPFGRCWRRNPTGFIELPVCIV